MEIHKKLLLILTIIIASLILYRLWTKRLKLENEPIEPPVKETFKPYKINLQNTVISTNSVLNTIATNQYFIKASWNTAYSGNLSMDISMVVKVLNRGCRFIDFEIYSVTDEKSANPNQPVVGYSPDSNSNHQTSSINTIPLYDALLTAITTSNSLTVKNDPLYIQLRIKSGIVALYENVMATIQSVSSKYQNLFYKNNNNTINPNKIAIMNLPLTPNVFFIADLVNSDPMFSQIIHPNVKHSLDNTNTPHVQLIENYKGYFSNYTVSDFTKPGITSISNATILKSTVIPPVIENAKTVKYYNCLTCGNNVNQFTESFPDLSIYNTTNPLKADILSLVMNYGVNILPMRFYMDDTGLADYESIFEGFGFITMAEILSNPVYKKINNDTNAKNKKI